MKCSNRNRGFVLLEVMLATTIFSLAVLGLILALNKVIQTSLDARRQNQIQMQLESRLAFLRTQPLNEGTTKEDPDDTGVTYATEIKLLQIQNQDKTLVPNLYSVAVHASWQEGSDPREDSAEIYVYKTQ